jgi:hypothetical protein
MPEVDAGSLVGLGCKWIQAAAKIPNINNPAAAAAIWGKEIRFLCLGFGEALFDSGTFGYCLTEDETRASTCVRSSVAV